ncbi:MAG: LamG-like jellyroll fold domain-containing protein, partial [Nitrosopumilus sp.]
IIAYDSVELTADFCEEQVGGADRRQVGLTMLRSKTVEQWAKAWRVYMGCFMVWEDGELRLIPAQADVDAQGALTLDGTSPTWANVGDQAILDFTASEDFTLEAWFKVSTGGVFQAIAGKKQTIGGADAGYILYLNSSDQLACRIHDGTNTAVDNTTTETFNDAKWHHVAMTIDQTANEMILFINGVARTPVSISAVTGTLENAQAFRMGAESNGTSRFTGLIDEVRVWNDERTPAEITANLLDEITDPTTDSSLLGYWKFNDQVGTTAVDASSQGNDATLSGVAGFTFGNGLLIPDGVTMHFQADDIVANSVRLEKRSIRNFPTVVDIEYTDQTADTWRIERQQSKAPGVVEGTTPARFTKISLPGIHRPAQAKREAIERINWYLSDLEITFTAFDEGLELLQGSIIAVTHPLGLTGKLMRIKRLTNNSGRWTVEAVEYDPQIYSDEVIADPSTPDTILGNPLAPPKVTGLTVVEELFIYKNGITGSRVRATWTSTYAFASSFLVEGFVDGNKVWQTNVTTVNEAVSPSVEELVTGTPVEYDVRVSIVTPFTTGAVEIKTVTIQGKLAAPSAVPEIRAVLTNANTADITWDAATDLDIWRYDLRRGLTSDTFDTATKMDLVDGLSFVAQNLGPPDFENPGDIKFFIKAVDTVGNVSPTAATATITTALPATPTGLAGIEIAGEVRATWNANQASDFVERYRFAFSDDPETFETTIDTVDGQRILTKDAPVGTFTFKIFAINALGESTADTVLIEVTEDFGAFLVDSFAFIAPVLTNVHEFKFSDTLSTGDVFYVTSPDSDDPFDTSATPHDFSRETFALANYHVPVTGTYVTETKDFGQLLTGSWRATDNLIVLDGTVEFTMELSTDDISFDVYTSKSAKGQYRYGRLRYVSLTESTMYIIRNPQKLDVSVIPIEESGEDTGSTSSFVRIELTREFGAVKEVNAQPKNALDAQMAVVDNIIVGKNTGIKFDGTNYLVGVDTAAFDIGATGVLSIEFWGNNPDSGSGQVFVCKKNSSTSTGWEIGKIASNSIRVTLDDGTSDVDFDTATTLPLDSTMHHIAVSIDRSADELSIYIDGVEDGNSPFNISGIANTLGNTIPFTIGARGNAGGALKNGTVIDEVRIWSDVRTSSEFADNRAIEIPITSTGLIGYWRMNDVLGTSVALADDQLLTPLTGNDLTNTGAGDLTYASISDTVSAKINYFDVYVFDIFGQQLAAQFQWNWKGV